MKKTQVDIRSEAFKKACNMLGEYFDDVVILCSWQENGGTMHAQAVLGSQYAALGMMTDYLQHDKAISDSTVLLDMAQDGAA